MPAKRNGPEISKGGQTILAKKTEFQLIDEGLTPREKSVASLLLYGKSRREIAVILGISQNTVKTHTQHILRKTGAKNQKALMSRYLIKNGFDDRWTEENRISDALGMRKSNSDGMMFGN